MGQSKRITARMLFALQGLGQSAMLRKHGRSCKKKMQMRFGNSRTSLKYSVFLCHSGLRNFHSFLQIWQILLPKTCKNKPLGRWLKIVHLELLAPRTGLGTIRRVQFLISPQLKISNIWTCGHGWIVAYTCMIRAGIATYIVLTLMTVLNSQLFGMYYLIQ